MSGRGRDLVRVALPFYGNLAVACQGERDAQMQGFLIGVS